MSAEQNKATVRRFYEEVWNNGNVDFAFEVFAEDYTRHDLRPTKTPLVPKDNGRSRPTSGRHFLTWNGRWT
jgi:ketosteroid isomerase-like protein